MNTFSNKVFLFIDDKDVPNLDICDLEKTFSNINKITIYENDYKKFCINILLNRQYLDKEMFNNMAEYICRMFKKHINIYYKNDLTDDKYSLCNFVKPSSKYVKKSKFIKR